MNKNLYLLLGLGSLTVTSFVISHSVKDVLFRHQNYDKLWEEIMPYIRGFDRKPGLSYDDVIIFNKVAEIPSHNDSLSLILEQAFLDKAVYDIFELNPKKLQGILDSLKKDEYERVIKPAVKW